MTTGSGRRFGAVVFISDRVGRAMRRRESCLQAAGIAHAVEWERRPSGTYFKLCVAERDAVEAYLALAARCGRAPRLREAKAPALAESLTDVATMFRNEARVAADRLIDVARAVGPLLLERLGGGGNRG